MSDQLKDVKRIESERYGNIDLDRLTAFGLSQLVERGIAATFENMVVTLFRLFPEKFALVGYDQYPDAARVNRALLHCMPKYRNYLAGSARSGYYLTDAGKGAAEEAVRLLEIRHQPAAPKRPRSAVPRSVADQFMREVTDSAGFASFKTGQTDTIGRYDMLRLLHADGSIRPIELRERLDRLIDYSKQTGLRDVERYLLWLANSFTGE